jgi:hypothetical protein
MLHASKITRRCNKKQQQQTHLVIHVQIRITRYMVTWCKIMLIKFRWDKWAHTPWMLTRVSRKQPMRKSRQRCLIQKLLHLKFIYVMPSPTTNVISPFKTVYMFQSYLPPSGIKYMVFKTQNRKHTYWIYDISQMVQVILNFMQQLYYRYSYISRLWFFCFTCLCKSC